MRIDTLLNNLSEESRTVVEKLILRFSQLENTLSMDDPKIVFLLSRISDYDFPENVGNRIKKAFFQAEITYFFEVVAFHRSKKRKNVHRYGLSTLKRLGKNSQRAIFDVLKEHRIDTSDDLVDEIIRSCYFYRYHMDL
ncbi:MAG: hypothetical protein PHU61_01960 [Candidatus Absconditabacteria bacterium]|nr:hypothetical protein [Candidatus Absconditabacteria bacterium]MDD3868475.1 hypothetical protein [Candidatus Absconditabacteria bacterium]